MKLHDCTHCNECDNDLLHSRSDTTVSSGLRRICFCSGRAASSEGSEATLSLGIAQVSDDVEPHATSSASETDQSLERADLLSFDQYERNYAERLRSLIQQISTSELPELQNPTNDALPISQRHSPTAGPSHQHDSLSGNEPQPDLMFEEQPTESSRSPTSSLHQPSAQVQDRSEMLHDADGSWSGEGGKHVPEVVSLAVEDDNMVQFDRQEHDDRLFRAARPPTDASMNDASKEIATRMLQGWTLLAEHCPRRAPSQMFHTKLLHNQ